MIFKRLQFFSFISFFVLKNKTKKKLVEADMEITTLNKQKTVVRVGQKQNNLQCT